MIQNRNIYIVDTPVKIHKRYKGVTMTHIYINDKQKKIIKKAADLDERSFSNFLVVSALERAEKIFHKSKEVKTDE